MTRASNADVADLRNAGFQVDTSSRCGEWEKEATFRKAEVSRGNDTVEIDWAADSAFRFFPIERDERLGWCLHLFDVATNKALTLSARTETRDYVDIVQLRRPSVRMRQRNPPRPRNQASAPGPRAVFIQ